MAVLPSHIDEYMESSIAHMLGLPCEEERLIQKLQQMEQSQRNLQLQVQCLQRQLNEMQHKCNKAKEEASLSAQSLKRQIIETQGIAEYCKQLTEECSRLESECMLYHNDREVFMEAADEAEERAAEAEDRAAEAEKRREEIVSEMEKLKDIMSQGQHVGDSCMADELISLRIKVKQMDAQNRRLQCELDALKKDSKLEFESVREHALKVAASEADMKCQLASASRRYQQLCQELQHLREVCKEQQARFEDEILIHSTVSSAVTAGACKALEQNHEAIIEAMGSYYRNELDQMEAKLNAKRERLRLSESCAHNLYAELHGLRKQAVQYEGNLKKAEVEVEYLFHENNELKLLLGGKHPGSDGQAISPLHIQGIKCHTANSNTRGPGKMDPLLGLSRQPLTPIRSNLSSEWRRQYR